MDVLVEDGDAAERTARPLLEVVVELGMKSLDKRPHERDLEHRPCYRTFSPDIHNCKHASEKNRTQERAFREGILWS